MSETRKKFIQPNINVVVSVLTVTSVLMMKIVRQINVVSTEQINVGMKRIIGSISFIIGDFRLLLKSEFWESKFRILCWLTVINLRFINFLFQVRSLGIFPESESESERSYKDDMNRTRIALLICMKNCEWSQKACRWLFQIIQSWLNCFEEVSQIESIQKLSQKSITITSKTPI
jgi:hypothetical protein